MKKDWKRLVLLVLLRHLDQAHPSSRSTTIQGSTRRAEGRQTRARMGPARYEWPWAS